MGCRQVQRRSVEEARAAGDGEATEWNVWSGRRSTAAAGYPILLSYHPACGWLGYLRNFFQHARDEGMLHCGFLDFRCLLNSRFRRCMGVTRPERDEDDRYTTDTGVRSLLNPGAWSRKQSQTTERGGEMGNVLRDVGSLRLVRSPRPLG